MERKLKVNYEPTDEALVAICREYNPGFDNMAPNDRLVLKFHCRQWLKAFLENEEFNTFIRSWVVAR